MKLKQIALVAALTLAVPSLSFAQAAGAGNVTLTASEQAWVTALVAGGMAVGTAVAVVVSARNQDKSSTGTR